MNANYQGLMFPYCHYLLINGKIIAAESRWRHFKMPAKRLTESMYVGEITDKCDVGDRLSSFFDQGSSKLKSFGENILVRGNAECLPERTKKMKLGHATNDSNFVDVGNAQEIFVNVLFPDRQTAKQFFSCFEFYGMNAI
jgi:hypothetical protein